MQPVSPLTNSPDVTFVKAIRTAQLIADWQQAFQIDISKEFDTCEEIKLYQCNQTKLRFFDPPITGSGKLYAQLQNIDQYYLPDRWEHQLALQDLFGCKAALEIGAASGYFVRTAIAAGLDMRGIELNQAAVATAQTAGLPVTYLDLKEAATLYERSLDGVCSFQVLEHVPDPKQFIQWAVNMLKPGGILIFCVPNAESFLKYQYNLLDMPPHHLTQWSDLSFRSLEEIFPVQLEKIIFEPLAKYHTTGYLSTYFNHFRAERPLLRLLLNRYTLSLSQAILDLGFRQYFRGQSLYVKFRKIQ
ncbi:class I SAM-dependent methyltransferase [Pantanalinema rosaneae CENA516]|uniref:class I SAM-dependent methyltransferase n=1 Tax=Pantanalinema rosaneae TaxID=1620701 RepID=UPI003D7007C2